MGSWTMSMIISTNTCSLPPTDNAPVSGVTCNAFSPVSLVVLSSRWYILATVSICKEYIITTGERKVVCFVMKHRGTTAKMLYPSLISKVSIKPWRVGGHACLSWPFVSFGRASLFACGLEAMIPISWAMSRTHSGSTSNNLFNSLSGVCKILLRARKLVHFVESGGLISSMSDHHLTIGCTGDWL